MKRAVQIILLIGSIFFFIVIIKYNFFTDSESKFYKDGWDSYENKEYDLTLFILIVLIKTNIPILLHPSGSSYMAKKDYQNAISNLTSAYNNGIGKKEGYFDKITNSLGIVICRLAIFQNQNIFYWKQKNKAVQTVEEIYRFGFSNKC